MGSEPKNRLVVLPYMYITKQKPAKFHMIDDGL